MVTSEAVQEVHKQQRQKKHGKAATVHELDEWRIQRQSEQNDTTLYIDVRIFRVVPVDPIEMGGDRGGGGRGGKEGARII